MNQWHYTAKGQPQGPISETALLELFHKGQLEPDALVWREGMPGWEPAQTALSKLLTSSPPPLPTPLVQGATIPVHPSMRDGEIDLGRLFSESWRRFKTHGGIGLLAYILNGSVFFCSLIVLAMGLILFTYFFKSILGEDNSAGKIVEQNMGVAVFILWWLFIVPPLGAGQSFFFIETARGRDNLMNLFGGFSRKMIPLILVYVIKITFIIMGCFLLLIPGIYLAIAYIYAESLVIDQNLGFWEALELSRKTVHRNWLQMFVLVLIPIPIAVSGLAFCCFGYYLTLPLAMFMFMFLLAEGYRQLFPQFQKPAE